MNLELTRRAEKDLDGLSQDERDHFATALDKLQTNPRGCDLKKLKDMADTWRLRIGYLRAILKLDKQASTLYVLTIQPRKDVYR